jgi:hypothetical protein
VRAASVRQSGNQSKLSIGFSGPKSIYRFDAFSFIFPIGLNEIKHLSIIFKLGFV